MGNLFDSYRANELANVASVSYYSLKVKGSAESESKWIYITATELEKIIAVLEPADYAKNVTEK